MPLIINRPKEVKGKTVTIAWREGPCSSSAVVLVHYKEVLPGNKASSWKTDIVLESESHYNLELKCFKRYQIAVGTGRTTGVKLITWKVKTGRGKKTRI